MREPFWVTSEDAVIACERSGEGATDLLLVHGAGGNLRSFDRLTPFLEEAFRIVAMDMRSHGMSRGGAPWTLQRVAEDMEEVVASAGLDRPVVLGHSVGALSAARYAASGSSCCAVVCVDGFGSGPRSFYRGVDDAQIDAWLNTEEPPDPLDVEGPFTEEELEKHLERVAEKVEKEGGDAEMAVNITCRNFVQQEDGTYVLNEFRSACRAMPVMLSTYNLFDDLRAVSRPILIVRGRHRAQPEDPIEIETLAAFRASVDAAIDDLMERRDDCCLLDLPTGHNVPVTMAEELAAGFKEFVEKYVG